jgi:hypothetical protein
MASACGPGAGLAGILGRPVCGEEERGEKREALTGGAREPEREARRHGSGWPMETDWRPMWRRGSADGKQRSADGDKLDRQSRSSARGKRGFGSGERPMRRVGPMWAEGGKNRPQGKGKERVADGLLADSFFLISFSFLFKLTPA